MSENIDDLKEKIKAILRQHGIRMYVSGCGCCGSPEVSFEKDGVKIVDGVQDFNIDMFEDDKAKGND